MKKYIASDGGRLRAPFAFARLLDRNIPLTNGLDGMSRASL
jgi:hypothetical protein